ncbi:MAG: hypothetical protein ABII09_10985 [Planctomycetota bacterium]
MVLSEIEKLYAKTLTPELKKALVNGEAERAASFAKALAKVYHTAHRRSNNGMEKTNKAENQCPAGATV